MEMAAPPRGEAQCAKPERKEKGARVLLRNQIFMGKPFLLFLQWDAQWGGLDEY